MKMLPIEQVSINLANLLIEQVREHYPDADVKADTDLAGMFLSVLAIYKDELVQLRDNRIRPGKAILFVGFGR
jgi:hypothetical protein